MAQMHPLGLKCARFGCGAGHLFGSDPAVVPKRILRIRKTSLSAAAEAEAEEKAGNEGGFTDADV
jgi:hypothetical protein